MLGMGGGQPDSDMKVYFAEIGIGKIRNIGNRNFRFFNLKFRIFANFGKIGNNFFLEFSIIYSKSATVMKLHICPKTIRS